MRFDDCVRYCAEQPEFVQQFNRMTGCRLGERDPSTPIDALIDEATGCAAERKVKKAAEAKMFEKFVYDAVWSCIDPADRQAGTADWLKGLLHLTR